MMKINSLAFYILFHGTVINAWTFPDTSFVHDVANKFERNGLVFHYPNLSKGNIVGYIEKY